MTSSQERFKTFVDPIREMVDELNMCKSYLAEIAWFCSQQNARFCLDRLEEKDHYEFTTRIVFPNKAVLEYRDVNPLTAIAQLTEQVRLWEADAEEC